MELKLAITALASPYPVPGTLDRPEDTLRAKGATIFTRVDHAVEAERVGLHMPPTQVLIFGNPKGGIPVMLSTPLSAIDLPLKALAWEDTAGKVWLSYNDFKYLQNRFGLPDEVLNGISGVEHLIQQAIA
jgi:uncharacterized protein (DUF302 family)